MQNLVKFGVAAIVVVALAAAVFNWFKVDPSNEIVLTPTETSPTESAPVAETAKTADEAVMPTSDTEPATAAVDSDASTDEASPFEVVENETEVQDQTELAQANSESVEAQPAADLVTNNAFGQANSEPVVVPASYSVTDAEKYFVPKDQRRPGNLGGPPPLNFPGGPSDPNRQ